MTASTFQAPSGSIAATQSDQETGTSTSVYVSPGTQQYHKSAEKVWCNLTGTGTIAIQASYNTTSITDNGTGDYTVTFTVAFSSALYSTVASGARGTVVSGTGQINYTTTSLAAGAVRVLTGDGASGVLDWALVDVHCLGDQ